MAEYIEGTFGPAWKKTLGGNLRPVEPAEFAELDKGTQLFDSQGRSLGFIKEATGDSVTITSVRGDEAEGRTAELKDLYVGSDSWVNANEAPVVMAKVHEEVKRYMEERYGKRTGAPRYNYAPRATDLHASEYDIVSRPSHYAEGRKYEPKDVIRDWELNFNLGSTVKYISRAGRKDAKLKDLRKARQFLDFEIEALEEAEDD